MPDSSAFKLTIRQGPRPNQTLEIDKDVFTIGREAGNDLVIEDPQVSRRHARLTRQGNSYLLEDLGSTNGTFVNGSRVTTPVLLAHNDLIGLADTIVLGVAVPFGSEATLVGPAEGVALQPPPTQPAFAPPKVVPQPIAAQPVRPQPQAVPVNAPPPPVMVAQPAPEAAPTTDNRRIILIGCGCLALLAIVAVLGLVAWSFIDCASFSSVFKFLFPPFAC